MTTKDPKADKATEAGESMMAAATSRAEELTASARDLAGKVPDAAEAMKDGALDAWRTVETMPRSQQKMLVTISLGIGAGFWLFGAPRLLTFLAFLPALVVAGTKAVARAGGRGRE